MNYLRPAIIGLVALAALVLLLAQGQPAHAAAITVNSTGDAVANDGVCTLREAITAANTDTASGAMVGECAAGSGADTIDLPAGTYTLSIAGADEDAAAMGDLDITDDLTINGAAATTTIVDGGALDRVFHIPGGGTTVGMSGLTIQNGNTATEGSPGGGIWNEGTLTLSSTTVSGNTATFVCCGGISNGHGSTLTLTNSTVSGNSSALPGGGGISNGGTLTLSSSTVTGNNAGGAGGGIDNGGTVTLTNSTVSGNMAGGDGGGIFHSNGTLTITNSTVSGNTAGTGGGIFHSSGTLTITNSTVSGNTASFFGGGIFHSNGTLTIIDSTVSSNTAVANGGGIVNFGTLTLTNVTVSGNTAGDDGGGIANGRMFFAQGTVTITNSTISGNTGGRGGGISNFSTVTLTNSTVSGNSATGGCCGGIFNDGTLTLTNTTVSGNSATGGCCGGIFNAGTLTLTDSTVSGNGANNGGGGIFNGGAGTVMLANSTVSGNTAGGDGGGIFNFDTVTLTNSTVSGNTAVAGGGGIFNFGTLTLTNSTISGNTSRFHGGGIYNDPLLDGKGATTKVATTKVATTNLNNVTVTNNVADSDANGSGDGGGILVAGGTANLKNSIVTGNTDVGGEKPDCGDTLNSQGHNLIQDTTGCTIIGDTTGNITGQDPLLVSLADNVGPTFTHALLAGSPAIDAGDNVGCPGADQRGVARPIDGDDNGSAICDIGAFEYCPGPNTDADLAAAGWRLGAGSPPPIIEGDGLGDACDDDDDNDGFPDAHERTIYGVGPGSVQELTPCPSDTVDDPWPPDVFGAGGPPDRLVDIPDVVAVLGFFGSALGQPGYLPRMDVFAPGGVIDIQDVLLVFGFFGQSCAPP